MFPIVAAVYYRRESVVVLLCVAGVGGFVGAGFMPAFKYHQRFVLAVLERGHKARAYKPGAADKIPATQKPTITLGQEGIRLQSRNIVTTVSN